MINFEMGCEGGSDVVFHIVDLLKHLDNVLFFLMGFVVSFLAENFMFEETVGGFAIELFDDGGDMFAGDKFGSDGDPWKGLFASTIQFLNRKKKLPQSVVRVGC